MTESIIIALISGGITLIGVLVANSRTQAVMETKLEALTREVREHNEFAKRIPLLEQRSDTIERNIKELQSLHERH